MCIISVRIFGTLMELLNQFHQAIEKSVGKDVIENRLQELNYFIDTINHVLRVHVPAEHLKQWLIDNHFDNKFKNILYQLTSETYNVHFFLQKFVKQEKKLDFEAKKDVFEEKTVDSNKLFESHKLNADYTFDSFIVGDSNELAFYSAKNVVDNPGGTNYNPLFLYGGVGLGKTHLIHGIGHGILKKQKNMNVVNLTTEDFLNEFMDALEVRRVPKLIDKFRKNCDILLIDDIQFLSGKKKTQEHFFHIFNHLRDAQKQIVITSDRYPQEIPDIEDRLKSRFEWGLIVEVLPPSYETRVKILKEKIKRYQINTDEETILFLANNLRSNIREIESVLKSMKANAELQHKTINIDIAREYLRKTFKLSTKLIDLEQIKKLVAKFYDLSVDDLMSTKRQQSITIPRQIAMYLSKKITDETLDEIGISFSRDHSTVINSIKKVESLLKTDIKMQKDIKILQKMITN